MTITNSVITAIWITETWWSVQQDLTRKDFYQNPEKIRSPKSVKYRENPVWKMQNPDINKNSSRVRVAVSYPNGNTSALWWWPRRHKLAPRPIIRHFHYFYTKSGYFPDVLREKCLISRHWTEIRSRLAALHVVYTGSQDIFEDNIVVFPAFCVLNYGVSL